MLQYKLLVIVLLYCIIAVNGCCPNHCSGHGHCSTFGNGCACNCFTGYTGGDCSDRTCPSGKAWSDMATSVDTAHAAVECSNRGHCDTSTGVCDCDNGFTGSSCNRLSCPNECSGHGECRSMAYHASQRDLGFGVPATYSNWDHAMVHGCHCETEYFGYDCSKRHCPNGDDPLTGTVPATTQVNEKQNILCTATSGTFTLSFKGKSTIELAYDSSVNELRTQLEALFTTNTVAVYFSNAAATTTCTTAGDNTAVVEFLQDFGSQPLMVADTSSLAHSGAGGFSLAFTIVKSQEGSKENAHCSNRGSCDTHTGSCQCYENYATSDGNGNAGSRGDCGYIESPVYLCPGKTECNGHGTCSGSPNFKCTCHNGWTSGDCSERTCPSAPSWFDYPIATDTAHQDAECSSMGHCNRETGECECAEGFEGGACERMSCPGSSSHACHGRGQCLTMDLLAKETRINGDPSPTIYGSVPNNPLTWDYNKIQGCACDEGRTGHDCSKKFCPFGDDPRTTGQVKEVQTIICTDAGTSSFQLTFRGQTTASIASDATSSTLETALEAITTLRQVSVSYSAGVSACTVGGTNTISILFDSELGDLPHLTSTLPTGSTILSFVINTDGTGTSVRGTVESIQCSNNGICNTHTGKCACFPGMGSSASQNARGHKSDCGFVVDVQSKY